MTRVSFGRPDATPTPMISLTRLAQVGCVTVAVALVSAVLLLRFGLPRWLDGPQRDAEREVRATMTAGLEAAARAGGLDAHAALRAARTSNARLLLFADGADGTRVAVEQSGYGGFFGGGVVGFCYRFTVRRGPEPQVTAARQDQCARPPATRPQATARIWKTAEKTRAALAAANEDGPITPERVRSAVAGDLGGLWSFERQSSAETTAVAAYISLTATGVVEAAECADFRIVRGPEMRAVTLYRLPDCPAA